MSLLLLLAGLVGGAAETGASGVAVVRTAIGAPGVAVREGAAEMLVLLEVARLLQQDNPTGLVAVGDRRGLFPAGAEEALRVAVLRGLPVVKLARGGRVLPAPHGLFLDGGNLTEAEVAQVLTRCQARHGTLPACGAISPAGPLPAELRERLRLFQNEITLAASTRLAVR